MDSTTFPIHSFALSTPDDEDVLAGNAPALGDLIFAWGMRDIELLLVAPLHQYTAQGMDPDSMIALGQELVTEGERLKELSGSSAEAITGPRGPQGGIVMPDSEAVRIVADSVDRAS